MIGIVFSSPDVLALADNCNVVVASAKVDRRPAAVEPFGHCLTMVHIFHRLQMAAIDTTAAQQTLYDYWRTLLMEEERNAVRNERLLRKLEDIEQRTNLLYHRTERLSQLRVGNLPTEFPSMRAQQRDSESRGSQVGSLSFLVSLSAATRSSRLTSW